jgi:hypothetical protein
MIGKLHPTSQANSWKSLEKFMFRCPFADAPPLPLFTQCRRRTRKHEDRISLRFRLSCFRVPLLPCHSNLPTLGSQRDLQARLASQGRPWNRQRSSESERFPYQQRCPWQKNAARREVAGFLFGWANRIKSLSVLSPQQEVESWLGFRKSSSCYSESWC